MGDLLFAWMWSFSLCVTSPFCPSSSASSASSAVKFFFPFPVFFRILFPPNHKLQITAAVLLLFPSRTIPRNGLHWL